MMPKLNLAVTSVLTMVILAACDDETGIEISQAEYGDKWPFTVVSGQLECIRSSKVIFHTGGATYAVNGMADADKRYLEIRPIWKDNPKIPGTKMNIGPIIDRGLALCS